MAAPNMEPNKGYERGVIKGEKKWKLCIWIDYWNSM